MSYSKHLPFPHANHFTIFQIKPSRSYQLNPFPSVHFYVHLLFPSPPPHLPTHLIHPYPPPLSQALSLSSGHHGSLEQALQQARSLLEDQRQENAELLSKMAAQSTEVRRLQTSNADLQSRLAMTELLMQQVWLALSPIPWFALSPFHGLPHGLPYGLPCSCSMVCTVPIPWLWCPYSMVCLAHTFHMQILIYFCSSKTHSLEPHMGSYI